jgi:hypothetical protein
MLLNLGSHKTSKATYIRRKLTYTETVVGFDQIPQAFIDLLMERTKVMVVKI